jgi:8-oxo-dGTP diphosphatase
MVKVGIGVILLKDGKVLLGKRINSYAPKYSIPGGHLEIGETFEEAAIREVKEETGITVKNPKVIAVTNNLQTYELEQIHYVSVILLTTDFSGKPNTMEPDKCEGWQWYDPTNLPQPHFDASEQGIKCFLENKFYK